MRGTDPRGNIDSTPATITFVVSIIFPHTIITAQNPEGALHVLSSNGTAGLTKTFSYIAVDAKNPNYDPATPLAYVLTGATFECRLISTLSGSTSLPWSSCENTRTYSGLQE